MQNYTINGDFLEKYLTLFLKLKQVITNSGLYFDYSNILISTLIICFIILTTYLILALHMEYVISNTFYMKKTNVMDEKELIKF